ncbi:hypothetical protein Bpfe_028225 [Biomphalaria pfeifferi]|uniref:Uncharacterized protein n=1 Tax=Biomphalaria pfeifferi TaxID=112525 RepID=A0AAD8EVX4_BIOPF|nr:hypothetical protein Bpfe_028225 [Biomphalaria pfeifferi]
MGWTFTKQKCYVWSSIDFGHLGPDRCALLARCPFCIIRDKGQGAVIIDLQSLGVSFETVYPYYDKLRRLDDIAILRLNSSVRFTDNMSSVLKHRLLRVPRVRVGKGSSNRLSIFEISEAAEGDSCASKHLHLQDDAERADGHTVADLPSQKQGVARRWTLCRRLRLSFKLQVWTQLLRFSMGQLWREGMQENILS